MPERKHIEAIEEALGIVSSCRNGRIAWPLRLRVVNLLYKALAACDKSPWRSMDSAPKTEHILAVVDGDVRVVRYGKTSHVPLYGWCIADMGPEDFDLCVPTCWMPLPAAPEVKP